MFILSKMFILLLGNVEVLIIHIFPILLQQLLIFLENREQVSGSEMPQATMSN